MKIRKYLKISYINTAQDFGKSVTVSHQFITKPDVLVSNLSFSHIREIMVLEDSFERFFYETECIKCNWSVRELRTAVPRAGITQGHI